MTVSLGLTRVIIESDSRLAIKLSVFEPEPPWDVLTLVLGIRHCRLNFGFKFAWVMREKANGLAHAVASSTAKKAHGSSSEFVSSPSALFLF
ncbi:hypothetical protein RHMOL_Rhmol07G0048500 [Rhododendron molle]|uniref:Uncharacterized protein n=1 Tax=Rhododendron molle TaxID=49168 RepID=A0ACC0MYA0_RHOML|nr:hypothetical protein RHMOL_Rhmol07G0048500 [Rhododendron molle]